MAKPTISFDDFAKLDLCVGKVTAVADVVGSDKLYRMTVDLGPDYTTRTIFAGVKPWYKKSQLKGKLFVFIANLAPRRMPTGESQGMMLAVDGKKPILLPVNKEAACGAALR